jgi:hypothetical protein
MTNALAFDTGEAIQKISHESGVEEEIIRQKMNEKITKFSGLLTEQGALVLVGKEMNVHLPLFEKKTIKISIGELKPGMNNVDVHARVKIADRIKTFTKNGKEGKYLSIRLEDETGEALFTFWNEQAEEAIQKGLGVGGTLHLTNARTQLFNQMIQISLGYNGTYVIEKNPNVNESPSPQLIATQSPNPFSTLTENAPFIGRVHVVDVLRGKGYYVRCTACQAKLQYRDTVCGQCGVEGKIETRLLVSLLLDDGTSTMRGVAFENEVLSLYQKEKEELLTAFENEERKKEIDTQLLGKPANIRGKGKVGMDRTSIELIIQKVEIIPFEKA